MLIVGWIAAAIFQTLIFKFSLLAELHIISLRVHEFALQLINRCPSEWTWFFGAILVGEDSEVRTRGEIAPFVTLGLYHLIVVSGSHVSALHQLIDRLVFFLPRRVRLTVVAFVLSFFTLANSLQPSCCRAYFGWLISKCSWVGSRSQADVLMIIVSVCLVLEPSWAGSLSFQLTVAASLGLAIGNSFSLQGPIKSRLATSVACTTLTAPLLLPIQECVSWIVIPANTVALPLFEIILLPASILAVAIPPLSFLPEWFISVVFKFSRFLCEFSEPQVCLSERGLKTCGLLYVIVIYLFWRLLSPLFIRARFWSEQKQYKMNSLCGMSDKATS